MTLRRATGDDLPAIMALERSSFPTDAWSEDTMPAEVASDHNVYLVDEEQGRVVGYGGVRALRGGADADIQTIALDPRFRGHGRGRALLRALITDAVARGARELFLEVRADNPVAHGLYESEGFVELGRRPRYYQPDDVDAVVMRLDLRAWGLKGHVGSGVGSSVGLGTGVLVREENSRSGGENPAKTPPIGENSSRTGDRETGDRETGARETGAREAAARGAGVRGPEARESDLRGADAPEPEPRRAASGHQEGAA